MFSASLKIVLLLPHHDLISDNRIDILVYILCIHCNSYHLICYVYFLFIRWQNTNRNGIWNPTPLLLVSIGWILKFVMNKILTSNSIHLWFGKWLKIEVIFWNNNKKKTNKNCIIWCELMDQINNLWSSIIIIIIIIESPL